MAAEKTYHYRKVTTTVDDRMVTDADIKEMVEQDEIEYIKNTGCSEFKEYKWFYDTIDEDGHKTRIKWIIYVNDKYQVHMYDFISNVFENDVCNEIYLSSKKSDLQLFFPIDEMTGKMLTVYKEMYMTTLRKRLTKNIIPCMLRDTNQVLTNQIFAFEKSNLIDHIICDLFPNFKKDIIRDDLEKLLNEYEPKLKKLHERHCKVYGDSIPPDVQKIFNELVYKRPHSSLKDDNNDKSSESKYQCIRD
jgi:hypothetical protein